MKLTPKQKKELEQAGISIESVVEMVAPKFMKNGGQVLYEEGMPNVEVEKGEIIMLPNGKSFKVTGKTHGQGGEDLQLDVNSKVISNHLKSPKNLTSLLVDKNKKMTFADIAKKYITDSDFSRMEGTDVDYFDTNTASRNIVNKNRKLDDIFLAQETLKEVEGISDNKAPIPMLQNGAVVGDPDKEIDNYINSFVNGKLSVQDYERFKQSLDPRRREILNIRESKVMGHKYTPKYPGIYGENVALLDRNTSSFGMNPKFPSAKQDLLNKNFKQNGLGDIEPLNQQLPVINQVSQINPTGTLPPNYSNLTTNPTPYNYQKIGFNRDINQFVRPTEFADEDYSILYPEAGTSITGNQKRNKAGYFGEAQATNRNPVLNYLYKQKTGRDLNEADPTQVKIAQELYGANVMGDYDFDPNLPGYYDGKMGSITRSVPSLQLSILNDPNITLDRDSPDFNITRLQELGLSQEQAQRIIDSPSIWRLTGKTQQERQPNISTPLEMKRATSVSQNNVPQLPEPPATSTPIVPTTINQSVQSGGQEGLIYDDRPIQFANSVSLLNSLIASRPKVMPPIAGNLPRIIQPDPVDVAKMQNTAFNNQLSTARFNLSKSNLPESMKQVLMNQQVAQGYQNIKPEVITDYTTNFNNDVNARNNAFLENYRNVGNSNVDRYRQQLSTVYAGLEQNKINNYTNFNNYLQRDAERVVNTPLALMQSGMLPTKNKNGTYTLNYDTTLNDLYDAQLELLRKRKYNR